tara:strand:- start:1803 stop:2624 length:822 start_codon:yes stop_codon:yes gene_type:complete
MDFLFIILFIAFLLTGIFSGFVAGLLGVGGGIIIVPITYFVLNYLGYSNDVIMHVAVASSLGIIVFTSISSILSHIKLNNVDYYVIKKWSPGIILGSVLGSIYASSIPGDSLLFIFVFLLFLVSINMFFQKKIFLLGSNIPKNFLLNFFISNCIGFLSSLIGIGGGSFSVPTLSAFSKSIHKAVGTSAVIGFFIALPGVLTYSFLGSNNNDLPPYSIGYANLVIIFIVASTSIFSANMGAKFSSKTKTSTLKKIFAVFLFCTCISLIIEQFIL